MQLKLSHLPLAVILALALPGTAPAQTGAAKVATVNGVAVPKTRVDLVVRGEEARGQKETAEMRAQIRDRLITLEIVKQEAMRKGLAKKADTIEQLEIARMQVLAAAFREDFFKNQTVPDDAMHVEYEKLKAQVGDKEYRARHVLVEREAEAKDIIARLKKGDKFEDLAKLSKDSGSKERGGDLDWNVPTGFVKPFSDAMVKLEKGKFTEEPVQTQFGWHVIMLEDTRPAKFPDFDAAKQGLRQRMQEALFDKAINDLRAKAKIE